MSPKKGAHSNRPNGNSDGDDNARPIVPPRGARVPTQPEPIAKLDWGGWKMIIGRKTRLSMGKTQHHCHADMAYVPRAAALSAVTQTAALVYCLTCQTWEGYMDIYTKVVLTIIAVALSIIALKEADVPVAQGGVTRVVICGAEANPRPLAS